LQTTIAKPKISSSVRAFTNQNDTLYSQSSTKLSSFHESQQGEGVQDFKGVHFAKIHNRKTIMHIAELK
jgi:hypothetical protein